jgi:hypothetical protein
MELELSKLKLQPKPRAAENEKLRGRFISQQAYDAAELLYAATVQYLLTLYIYFPDKLKLWSNPVNTGTLTTERLICDLQGKTTQFQSLDAQPTYVDILNRISILEDNQSAEDHLRSEGINIPESNHLRTLNREYDNYARDVSSHNITVPKTLADFKASLIEAINVGKIKADVLVTKYLPEVFKQILEKNGTYTIPYIF